MRIPKASEFFIAGIEGTELNAAEHRFIREHALGGVILFKRNIESLPQVVLLNQAIINSHQHPPAICVDQEGGRVARLRGICTDLPPINSLSQAFMKNPHLAYRIGAMQGRELASLGFNVNFAPVCDVVSNQENQVIGDRAFSDDPMTVAILAAQYIRGLQGSGVAACAKHFPGHGATSIDSHLALPVIDIGEDILWRRELLPFQKAIDANVATIMTAHIITKSIDSWPATLSEKTLSMLLRRRLGYNHVVISDDLTMKAVFDNYSLREIIERAMLASVDLFIIGNDFALTLEAIALLDDLIASNEQVRKSAIAAALRIAELRNRYIGKPKAPELLSAQAIVRSAPHLELVRSCQ